MTTGERLRALRKKKHLTQAELADSVGCCAMTIRRYEKDMRRISSDHFAKLCDVLDASKEDLEEVAQHDPLLTEMILMYERWSPMQREYMFQQMRIFDVLTQSKSMKLEYLSEYKT